MSEKRFEAERYPYAYGGGTWAIYDNQATHGRTVYREFAYDYVGGPQAAAEAEAARLNAWWQEEQAKNKRRAGSSRRKQRTKQ